MVKNRITQIFFIVFSLIIFCDKLWADEVPYAQAIPSVEDEITGSWFGKCIDYSSGQAYEIELLVSKNFNNQFECTMQISDYKSVYKHCFAISAQDYIYYLKDLDSKYLSGIQNANPVLQNVWLHTMLTPIVFNKILVGNALVNTSKLLSITLKKENSDKNFAKISAIDSITQSNIKNNLVEKPVLDNKIPSSLKANVIFDNETLPSLKASAIFDEKKLPKTDSYRLWYRIPNWAAGTWVAGSLWSRWMGYKYSITLGCQADKLGNIWDTMLLPSYSTSTSSSPPVDRYVHDAPNSPMFNIYSDRPTIDTRKDIIFACSPGDYNNQDSWTFQFRSQQICFLNNVVNWVWPMNTTDTYRLIKPGEMSVSVFGNMRTEFGQVTINHPTFNISRKMFRENPLDQVVQLEQAHPITLKLKQPFKPRNLGKDGTDLKADFINYLRSHNLNDLVPN